VSFEKTPAKAIGIASNVNSLLRRGNLFKETMPRKANESWSTIKTRVLVLFFQAKVPTAFKIVPANTSILKTYWDWLRERDIEGYQEEFVIIGFLVILKGRLHLFVFELELSAKIFEEAWKCRSGRVFHGKVRKFF